MEKVRLDLNALQVQSFTTDGAGGQRGTVRANSADPVNCPTYDNAWDTCWDSCNAATCGQSCGGTCDCESGMCGGSESYFASNCQ